MDFINFSKVKTQLMRPRNISGVLNIPISAGYYSVYGAQVALDSLTPRNFYYFPSFSFSSNVPQESFRQSLCNPHTNTVAMAPMAGVQMDILRGSTQSPLNVSRFKLYQYYADFKLGVNFVAQDSLTGFDGSVQNIGSLGEKIYLNINCNLQQTTDMNNAGIDTVALYFNFLALEISDMDWIRENITQQG
jgi:hypothetical protein